jgi:uncharacterized membrane protein YkoI
MKRYLLLFVIAAVISIAQAAPKTLAASGLRQEDERREKSEKRGEAKDQEKSVKMKDLPAAVQQTVREQSKGAVIRGLAQETENGETNYEVELRVNGHNKDVLISPTGAVVEIEEQVMLSSLPSAAKTAIEQKAGGGKIVMVESLTKNNTVVSYEAHVRRAGKSREIKVSPEGQLIP